MSLKGQQALSLEKKVKILNEVDEKRLTKTEIAAKFNIVKSTLSTILKNLGKIVAAHASSHFEPKRKRMRTVKHEEVEIALTRWLSEARKEQVTITGAILQE